MKALLRSVALVSALGLGATAANAVTTTTCPSSISGYTSQMTLVTASDKVECWDYGTDFPYDVTRAAVTVDDGILQLPTTWTAASETPVAIIEDPPAGSASGLTITTNAGNKSGLFYFLPNTLSKEAILVFKAGDENSGANPVWFAFKFTTGFQSAMTDSWSIGGTEVRGLSNTRLFTSDGGDEYLVPIPAAAWLLGTGLIGLIGIGRRRKTAVATA